MDLIETANLFLWVQKQTYISRLETSPIPNLHIYSLMLFPDENIRYLHTDSTVHYSNTRYKNQ